jgi:hypothetical protein
LEQPSVLEIILLIAGVVIGSIAIGVAVQAWRTWSAERRIENHSLRKALDKPLRMPKEKTLPEHP